jgi:cytochrome c biogenesis protein CcmG, thiol:disulfide interchange protein DsbE
LAASTRTLASEGPSAARLGLAGLSLVAVLAFALYAAFLASRVEEVIAPVEIALPMGGATSPLGLGQTAPDFSLTDIEGRQVKLSDFAGRPVWVNVWASWCAPCRAEAPDIDAAYRELRGAGGNGLVLLMVSLGEDPTAVRRYLDTVRYELPVLVDPGFTFAQKYRVSGLPTHYFIGRDGTIRDLAIGGLKPKGMRSRLTKLLAS